MIDVSDPATPQELGFEETLGWASGVAVSGNYAYVADMNYGLRVIDISNSSNPHEVGYYEMRIWTDDVAISGNYAYVANYNYGLRIIDVSIPSSPQEVGYYDMPIQAKSVVLSGDYAFVASGEWGMIIFHNDLLTEVSESKPEVPMKFELIQNSPNPFNPSTKIKYSLPKSETVKIEIFNTLGQKVETLINKHMPAGFHEIEFNATNLSSAIYFYQIQAGEYNDVKKMILLK